MTLKQYGKPGFEANLIPPCWAICINQLRSLKQYVIPLFQEWKIGRHASHGNKFSKVSKKLFQAPIYTTVKYPPYNVPLNQ